MARITDVPRLVTFGCSHTTGEGLPDCLHGPPGEPEPPTSKFAWPHVLAEKLGMEYLNLARGGASNKEINYLMLRAELQKEDIVVFLWTHHNRSCFFDSEEKLITRQLVPSYTEKRKNSVWQ